jgi:predicted aminopeptidase
MDQAQWTQDEAIAYECARECITHLRAIYTAEIYDEERKAAPDRARIDALRVEQARLYRERKGLRVKDAATIERINREYGALIRVDVKKSQAAAA